MVRVSEWMNASLRRRALARLRDLPPPSRPRRAAALTVAVFVQAGSIGALLLGAWLCTVRFPGVALLPGVVLLAFGVLTVPRPQALPRDVTRLSRTAAPALHELVDRVADALQVPRPRIVAVDDRLSASSGFDGWRRRRYVLIGAPLWAVLDAPGRLALLAVELARSGTGDGDGAGDGAGDPGRSAVTGGVERSLAALQDLLEPRRDESLRALQDPTVVSSAPFLVGTTIGVNRSIVWVGELLLAPVVLVLQGGVALVRLAYLTLLQPDAFRAVYAADARAARLAGSAAVGEVLAVRLLAPSIVTVLRREVRAGDHAGAGSSALRRSPAGPVVAAWPALAAEVLAGHAADLPALRRASIEREASAFALEPPLGRRAEMVPAAPAVFGATDFGATDFGATVSEATGLEATGPTVPELVERTDAELAAGYHRVVHDLRFG